MALQPIEISKGQAKYLIKHSNGKIFVAIFVKKNGQIRTLNGRLGVRMYLKGGRLPYDPEQRGLIPVFDTQKRAYRIINLHSLRELRISGKNYSINPNL